MARWHGGAAAIVVAMLLGCGGTDDGNDPTGRPDIQVVVDISFGDNGPAQDDGPATDDGPGTDPGPGPTDPGPAIDHGPGYDPGPAKDDGPAPKDDGPKDSGPPCPFETSPNGFVDNCDGTITDPRTGLMWERDQNTTTDPKLALAYCGNRWTGEHFDWKLPTIDQLRSLVIGCPASATGGACGVTGVCNDENTCWNATACGGCGNGTYTDPFLKGNALLSFSMTPVKAGGTGRYWYLQFFDAAIDRLPSGASFSGIAGIRCVRQP